MNALKWAFFGKSEQSGILYSSVCLTMLPFCSLLFYCLDWLSETAKRSYKQGKRSTPGKTTYKPKYSFDDVLAGRENYEAYADFFKYFIYQMGKKTYWKQTIQNATNDQDMATKSTEAFALLLLENPWDRLLDFLH